MTGLSYEGTIISLDDASGIHLGLDMLGRKYSTKTIRYFDLLSDYMFLPHRTREECVCMARAFLLHLLRAYLFANGGQTVSLRWLTLFQDFGEAQRANWRQACLAYLYSTLDTLSRGTLQQLVGPWKLLERWVVRYGLITPSTDLVLREFSQVRAYLARLTSDEVNWTPWAGQPLPASRDLELATLIALEITWPFEKGGLRVLNLVERVQCQLVGKDEPQIPMNSPKFILAPHSMTDAKYNSWGSGISYAERLLKGLNYEEFNITRLMLSLIIQ